MLYDEFITLLKSVHAPRNTIEILWREIETHYTSKNRHHHTLTHLENMLRELIEVKPRIEDWTTLLFSLYYHDIIYNIRRSDNELKSAEFASNRLESLGIPKENIEKCKQQILATILHHRSDDSDTNYFLDSDLSILGSSNERYEMYSENIRKEYRYHPEILYRPGRKKVIKHFLAMDCIFKTDHFIAKFEEQARRNLQWELNRLN